MAPLLLLLKCPVIDVIRLLIRIIRRIEKQPIITRRTGVFPPISHHHSPPRLVHSVRMHLSGNLLQIRRIGFCISTGSPLELSGIAGNTVPRIIVSDHAFGNGNTAKAKSCRRNIHVIDHRIGRSRVHISTPPHLTDNKRNADRLFPRR